MTPPPAIATRAPTFASAAASFRRFFDELRGAFFERETLLTQIELGLLCREHVLAMGPPGTAKSVMAGAILNRIVDERTGQSSVFAKQLSESTVQTDLIGPVDFKVLTETGRTEYLTDDGMLGFTHAFLDEVFDGREMLLRSILNVLNERELKHGRRVTTGRLECAVMTSNRYLSEVVARSPELMVAFADRLSFISYVPKGFARASSRAAMLAWSVQGQRPVLRAPLTLQELDVLQAAVDKVQVPSDMLEGLELLADELERRIQAQVSKLPDYVPTKYFSQRSVVKALWALKAGVVRDAVYHRPDRELSVRSEDLDSLRSFFLLGGPPPEETELLLQSAVDPRERAQLEIVKVEHQVFDEALEAVRAQLGGGLEREAKALAADEDLSTAGSLVGNFKPRTAEEIGRKLEQRLVPGPRHPPNRLKLVAAARSLVAATQARLNQRAFVGGEGFGLDVTVRAIGAVLELARTVPELAGSVEALVQGAERFGLEGLQLTQLSAKALELEPIKLETLSTTARRLARDLGALHELSLFLDPVSGRAAESLRERERAARQAVAKQLRAQVEAIFASGNAFTAQPTLDALAAEARRLGAFEKLLSSLSPEQQGLRQQLLQPVAREYVLGVCQSLPFQTVEQYGHGLQSVAENLRQEGLEPGPILTEARGAIESRLQRFSQQALETILKGVPTALTAEQVLNGEAYQRYQSQFQGTPMGTLNAAAGLAAQLASEAPAGAGPGRASLAEPVLRGLAEAELGAHQRRLQFLRGWLEGVSAAFAPQEVRSRAEADKLFERLLRTRLGQLVLKEGELVRIEGALRSLAERLPAASVPATKLENEARALGDGFEQVCRRLLETRARAA